MDPFKILGIDKDATTEEVQRAYRKKAAKHHPDAGGDSWAFQHVQEAYEKIMRARTQDARRQQPKGSKPARPRQKPKANPKAKTKSTSSQSRNPRQHPPKASPGKTTTRESRESEANANGYRKLPGSISSRFPFWLKHLLTGELPLQTEVCVFILVGVLDIVMTNLLLRNGAVEANPIARFFLHRWGFHGMIFFKMATIAFVTVLAQIVAQHKMSSAKKILHYGTVIVGIVVCYSAVLLLRTR